MFDGDDDGPAGRGDADNGFSVNRDFEKRFNERKKREELEKAISRHGRGYLDALDGEESSSSLAEDEEGVLDTEEITMKVLSTISKIRAKDPEIYNSEKKYFDDKDFEASTKFLEKGALGKREKAYTYRDMVAEGVARGTLNSEEEEEEDETPFEVEQRIKREFKKAVGGDEEEEEDFMKVKKKTEREKKAERKEMRELREKEEAAGGSEGDRFLRRFILSKGWVNEEEEGERERWRREQEEADREDEMREEEVDEFEERLNFRFERVGGGRVTTYERGGDDTMRKKETKRSDKRKERDERKKEEERDHKEEAEMLKGIKREEIERKVLQVMAAGGLNREMAGKAVENIIRGGFDDEKFDGAMDEVFNDDYYGEEDDEEEMKKYVEEIDEDIDRILAGKEEYKEPGKEGEVEDELARTKVTPNLPLIMKKKIGKEEAMAMQESMKTNIWWYCDNCGRGIRPLEARFDCMECEDYTECKQCAEMKNHDHKMKRFIVPEGCEPPASEKITEYLQHLKTCGKCGLKIDDTQLYYQYKEDETYTLCEACVHYSKKVNKKEFERVAPRRVNVQKAVEEGDFHKLEKLVDDELIKTIDEYHQLDYEDVIAGGLKTRFKYVSVEGDDYKLDDDDMLYADDRILNRYLSMKKIAPYRSEEITDKHRKRMKKMLSLVKISASKNRQLIVQNIELNKEEDYLKTMSKKNSKYKKKLDKFLEKKERILKNQEFKANDIEIPDNQDVKLTDYTNVEVPQTEMSSNRLKSYGL